MKPSEVKMKRNYSLPRRPARTTAQAFFTKPTLIALLLGLCSAAISLRAASPPPATLMYTTTNNAPVHGGIATIGPLANTYFSILSTPTNAANVKKLTTGGTVLWTFNGPGVGTNYDMYAVPALDAAGAKLYIGSDAGIFYCLNTTDGSTNWTYTVTNGTDKRIRSGAALDP